MYQRSTTKSERAYQVIRRMIVTGEISEGAHLDEAELTERLGLGRTPLREALKRLAMEKFLVWPSHGTPSVRVLGLTDLYSLYESRFLLEVPVARLAAERATASDLAKLNCLVEEMGQAVEAGDVYQSVELDYEFHVAVAAASQNRFLAEAVAAQNSGVLRLWYRSRERVGLAGTVEPHAHITAALQAKDADESERLAHAHAQRSYQRQLAQYGLDADTPAAARP